MSAVVAEGGSGRMNAIRLFIHSVGSFLIADCVTDTGDKAGNSRYGSIPWRSQTDDGERGDTGKQCKSRNFVCLDHCWVLNMYFLSGTPVPSGIY